MKRRDRIQDRRDRYAKIEESEKESLKMFKLTLDNVDDDKLTPLSEFDEERFSGMIRPKEESDADSPDREPEAPSGLDFVRRETILSLVDLIELNAAAQTAKVGGESSGS